VANAQLPHAPAAFQALPSGSSRLAFVLLFVSPVSPNTLFYVAALRADISRDLVPGGTAN